MKKSKKLPLKPDGTIDWDKMELPKIDLRNASIEYIEPTEEDKRRLMEYKIKIGEIKPEDIKNF